jgi:cytosine/adenosine deaminase-related metal-dependent hydrolase
MSSSTCFLLKSATVILHQQDDQVVAEHIDILVRDNFIVAIADNTAEPKDITEVIDCSDTIISPGFVDTHRHLWQTQLKGRHSDNLLTDYVPRGYLAGFFYNVKDVQFGELSGALESIDAGTTTVVDHMHIAYSPAHIESALTALVASGVRGVFCPTPTVRVKQ